MKSNDLPFNVLRIVLGVFLILYALNKFFQFLPTSYGAMPEVTKDFLDAVAGYLPALYIFEMIIGIFLIFNKWTPFVLIVLFPLSVAFLIFSISNGEFSNAWSAIVVALLNIILIVRRKEMFASLFI
jgi:putative oxidoreductase